MKAIVSGERVLWVGDYNVSIDGAGAWHGANELIPHSVAPNMQVVDCDIEDVPHEGLTFDGEAVVERDGWQDELEARHEAWRAANVPEVVTPFQARTALRLAGHFDNVMTIINAADDMTKDAWEYATEFRRTSPLLNGLAQQLGISQQQLDELFIAAGAVEA